MHSNTSQQALSDRVGGAQMVGSYVGKLCDHYLLTHPTMNVRDRRPILRSRSATINIMT